jgi:SAM-dependent methyltransferase
MSATEVSAYTQAVSSGQYARVTGLHGKYDHVRLAWEDRSLQVMLQPHLETLVNQRASQGKGVRVADLGCGSGDGMETLLTIAKTNPPRQDNDVRLIPPDTLDKYTGLEMNPALLEQAKDRFAGHPRTAFVQADLREGLPFGSGEKPYDLYAASFGTLSHFSEDQTVQLLSEIVTHAAPGALLVGDWLGRYSYEWTDLWNCDTASEQWMDYRISYIYPPEERAKREIDSFGLRLLSDAEVRRVVDKVSENTGAKVAIKSLFDRSMFVGRHMDTADYNRNAVPLRSQVNRLHEPGCRTELDKLRFELTVPDGFDAPGRALKQVADAWNQLIEYTAQCLAAWDRQAGRPDVPAGAPALLQEKMARMWELNELADRMGYDDPRAEWIEPQLAFGLRDLELQLQQGLGCGHGLVVICEVMK